jgi:type 1 glutamine amidotransferase
MVLGLAACGLAGVSAAADAPAKKKIQVLLITGDDVAPFHQWREISEATREALVASGRFDVKVCEDPLILESESALRAYDVLVFTLFARSTPTLSSQAQENLLKFVEHGKGFFIQHLASASFANWQEFGKLCGRKWVMGTSGHGPRSVFEVKIVNDKHPITLGMKPFKVDDELYAKLQGDEPIEVLAEADSDWSKKTEPLVFTRTYGKGRVVHNAFGHDRKAILTPEVARIIARGTQWAATGKVAD